MYILHYACNRAEHNYIYSTDEYFLSIDCKHRVPGTGVSIEDPIVDIIWIAVIQHMFYLVNKYMLWFVYDILFNTYQPTHLRKTMDTQI